MALGDGTLDVSGPNTLTFNDYFIAGVNTSFGGSANLAFGNILQLEGRLFGSGSTSFSAGGGLLIPPGNPGIPSIDGRIVDLNASSVLDIQSSRLNLRGGAIINNGGDTSIRSDMAGQASIQCLTPADCGTFNNLGAGTFSANSDVSVVLADLVFNNQGAMEVLTGRLGIPTGFSQTAGTLRVNPGTQLDAPSGLSLAGGALNGVGTVNGNVTLNGGAIAPGLSPGIITINGNLTVNSGDLNFDIDGSVAPVPGVTHDQLVVSGSTNFTGGRLLVPAGTSAESFTLISSASGSGVPSVVGGFAVYGLTRPGGNLLYAPSGSKVCTFNLSSPGDWDVPAHWTCVPSGGFPGAADTAVVNNAAATVNQNGARTVAGLQLSAGTISGTAALTVTDSFAWTGGSLLGDAGNTDPVIIASTVTSAALAGAQKNLIQREFRLDADASWTTGLIALGENGVFTILPTRTLTSTPNAAPVETIQTAGVVTGAVLNNQGRILKTGTGLSGTTGSLTYSGNGAIEVAGAGNKFFLHVPGVMSGTYTTAAATELEFANANRSFAASSRLAGAGRFIFGNGGFAPSSNTFDGQLAPAFSGRIVVVERGTLSVNTTPFVLPNLELAGASALLTGPANFAVTNQLDWRGGTVRGLAVSQELEIRVGASASMVSTVAHTLDTMTLRNRGLFTRDSSGDFAFRNGALFINEVGATTRVDAVGQTQNWSEPVELNARISNLGTFEFLNCTDSVIDTDFDNQGTVTQNCPLRLNDQGTDSGSYTVNAPLLINPGAAQTRTMSGASALSGSGVLNVLSGTLNLAAASYSVAQTTLSGGILDVSRSGSTSFATLSVAGGTLRGSDNFVVSTQFNWTGGIVQGNGTRTLTAAANGFIPFGASRLLDGRRLVIGGSTSWTDGNIETTNSGGIRVDPAGILTISTEGRMFCAASCGAVPGIENQGRVNRSGNTGITTLDVGAPFIAFGGGVLEVALGTLQSNDAFQQSNGEVTVSGASARLRRSAGQFTFAAAGAKLSGIGTVEGRVQLNAGVLDPGLSGVGTVGTLSVLGDLNFGTGANLQIDLSGAGCSAFDVVAVSNLASYGGRVNFTTGGGCAPVPPQAFNFVTAVGRSGTFQSVTGLPAGYAVQYPGGNGNAVLGPAGAPVYEVDTTTDNGALTACVIGVPNDCSLRGAITRANTEAGAGEIRFNIPGSATQTITLSSAACPTINSDPLIINGYSQPGASANTQAAGVGGLNGVLKIELRGGGACTSGIAVDSSQFTVSGIAFGGFNTGAALLLQPGVGAQQRIYGNYFGSNADGTDDAANQYGVAVAAQAGAGTASVELGCGAADRRNLFAGFTGAPPAGIDLRAGGAGRVRYSASICGNLFGLVAAGNLGLDNHTSIRVRGAQFDLGSPLLIGGPSADERNSFGSNQAGAAHIDFLDAGIAGSALIQGNQFGYTANGSGAVAVDGKQANVRGGVELRGNRMQGGADWAIAVVDGIASRIQGNTSFGHAGLAIDLAQDGRTVNDLNDLDSGPNTLLNFPEITSVTPVSGDLSIGYSLSTPVGSGVYPIQTEFFKSTDDEGQVFLGSHVAITSGVQSTTFTPTSSYAVNEVIVAVATDSAGNSSEFSFYPVTMTVSAAPNPVLPNAPITASVSVDTVAPSPFKALGTVRLSLNAAGNPGCDAALVQSLMTPRLSSGSCVIAGAALGSYTLTGSLNARTSAFAAADGSNATASAPLAVQNTALVVGDLTIAEGNSGNSVISVPVSIAGPGPYPFNVSFTSSDGTAVAGSDYTGPASGNLVFAAAGTQNIAFQALGDLVVEANEGFSVAVLAPTATPASQTSSVTITNDDSAVLTLTAASVLEGNSGSTPLSFALTSSASIQGNVSILATTTNGSATAPSDFVALNAAPFVLPSLAQSTAVLVSVNGDTLFEPNESFSLAATLTLPPGVTAVSVLPSSVTGTILNDDVAAATTTVISSFAPVALQQVGQAFTVNVTVTSSAGPAPTGLVQIAAAAPFASDTCTLTLGAPTGFSASGSCSITASVPGQRAFTASYAGDGSSAPSSGTGGYVVQSGTSFPANPVQQSATTTVVGEPFTVSVRIQGIGAAPTGSISVLPIPVGNQASCNLSTTGLPPNVSGCTVTIISPAAVSKLLRVRYNGSGGQPPSFAPVERTVDVHDTNKAATSVLITADTPDPSLVSAPVQVSFRVAVMAPGASTPISPLNGSVEITDGTDRCTSSNLQSGANSTATGSCVLSLTTLGSRPLSARYLGNENFLGSVSPNEPHTVVGAGSGTDLAVQLGNRVRNLLPGSVEYSLRVRNNGPLNAAGARVTQTLPNLLGNVVWTCSALPPNSCPASGTGAIDRLVDLISGGEVVFRMTGTVPAGEGLVTTTATVTPPAGLSDPVPGNNAATDTDPLGLLGDGFEVPDSE